MKTFRNLVIATAIVLTLGASCDGSGLPANPTVGQTGYAQGNEDVCVWTGQDWVEQDDREPCTAELDGGHGASKRRTTATRTRRASVPAPRRDTARRSR